jgi:hypothetical protein
MLASYPPPPSPPSLPLPLSLSLSYNDLQNLNQYVALKIAGIKNVIGLLLKATSLQHNHMVQKIAATPTKTFLLCLTPVLINMGNLPCQKASLHFSKKEEEKAGYKQAVSQRVWFAWTVPSRIIPSRKLNLIELFDLIRTSKNMNL